MDVRTETERRFILDMSEEEAQILARALGEFTSGLTSELYNDIVDVGGTGPGVDWYSDFTVRRNAVGVPYVVRCEDN